MKMGEASRKRKCRQLGQYQVSVMWPEGKVPGRRGNSGMETWDQTVRPKESEGKKSGDHRLGTGESWKAAEDGWLQGIHPLQARNGKKLGEVGQGPSWRHVSVVSCKMRN